MSMHACRPRCMRSVARELTGALRLLPLLARYVRAHAALRGACVDKPQWVCLNVKLPRACASLG